MFVALNQVCAIAAFLGAALAGLAWARACQMAQVLAEAAAPSRRAAPALCGERAATCGASLHDVRDATASAFFN